MEPHLFLPADKWWLLAIIVGAPLFGAFFNGVFGKRLGKPAVRLMGVGTVALSFIAAVFTFLQLQKLHHHAEEAAKKVAEGTAAAGHAAKEVEFAASKLSWLAWQWMSVATQGGDGRMSIDVKYSVDELSGVMMLVVTGVGLLIHLYSSSYMAKDPGYHRFFAYLNLFVFSMLTLILADNLVLLFVGWEGVGACSYLLIGFWYDKAENASAGKKAFIANRIGDVGVIGGMLLVAYYCGALDWDGINHNADKLLDSQARITLFQFSSGKLLTISAATAACLAFFLGCTGKSAQIPLYVWLPDAMAGPTPVSALIHAATMVTSGLYLICRLNVVFSFSPFAMMIVAIVGALTALFAATIGLVQNDIKKVLAYSTVSQLGFMFLGVGVGAFGMGFFHVLTHAFFKACLFLGAGSVIHAMHARIHDDVKSQDMRFMGGLKKYMPWTYASMGVATLAISGFPFTSGFFSKDGILFHAYANKIIHPYAYTAYARIDALKGQAGHEKEIAQLQFMAEHYFQAPAWLGPVLFGIGVVAATCTSFYMFRLLFKTFWGDFRGWKVDPAAALATDPLKNEEPLEVGDTGYGLALTQSAHTTHGGAEHETADPHDVLEGGHDHGHDDHGHHEDDLTKPAAPPMEAPWTMAFPVAILGALAAFAGFLWAEPLHLEALGEWLSPVFHETVGHNITTHASKAMELGLMGPGILACFIGLGFAYQWYVKEEERTPARLAAEWPRLHRAAYNKWYVDELYDATIIGGTDALADGAALMDTWIVDGILAKLTALLVSALGSLLRAFQTGVVHVYGAILAIGTLGLVVFFVRPHAEATVAKEGASFVVEAAPGIGYEYKWNVDGKEEPSFLAGDSAMKRQVQVAEGASSTVVLEVRNSFGRTAKHTFTLSNPKPEPAGLPVGATPGSPPPRPAGH